MSIERFHEEMGIASNLADLAVFDRSTLREIQEAPSSCAVDEFTPGRKAPRLLATARLTVHFVAAGTLHNEENK